MNFFMKHVNLLLSMEVHHPLRLQRRFKIGYNRAARLMDIMEKQGFISEAHGSKPREVFITEAELESMQEAK